MNITTSTFTLPIIPDHYLASLPPDADANGYREYDLVVHSHDHLDSLYADMENAGGPNTVPQRAVPCSMRLPSSRTTKYRLNEEEATLLSNDPRIWAIELTIEERGLKPIPHWTNGEYSAYWQKGGGTTSSGAVSAPGVNWALLRSTVGQEISGWASDNGSIFYTGTAYTSASGKNVDVVIMDNHLITGHPEAAVNTDGTGGTRMQFFNWLQYAPAVVSLSSSTYVYGAPDGDHGGHVTGIAAGNTCGWARDANIYNINPYGTSTGNSSSYVPGGNAAIYEYVKQFHINKPINPLTGRRNPTVCNSSWGLTPVLVPAGSSLGGAGYITSMSLNGTVFSTSGWSAYDFAGIANGVTNGAYAVGNLVGGMSNGNYGLLIQQRSASLEAAIQDCIAAGVIMVGAAGNFWDYDANTSDPHYNDYIVYTGPANSVYYSGGSAISGSSSNVTQTYYLHRGGIQSCVGNICVSAVDPTIAPQKSGFSTFGTRTDIFAPGANIMSSSNGVGNEGPGVTDPRNASFYKLNLAGTSMATPQVAGMIALILETYPYLTQADVLNMLTNKFSTNNQLYDAGGAGWTTYLYVESQANQQLAGAPNRYLYFYPERPYSGEVFPKQNYFVRPTAGQTWPRPRIRITG